MKGWGRKPLRFQDYHILKKSSELIPFNEVYSSPQHNSEGRPVKITVKTQDQLFNLIVFVN